MDKKEIINLFVRECQKNNWNYTDTAEIMRRVRLKLDIKPPKSKHLPYVMSKAEVKIFIQGMNTLKYKFRDITFFELLYRTGLRVSEACNLKVGDINFEEFRITVRDGKGQKDRVVPYPQTQAKDLRQLIEIANGSKYLFINPKTGLQFTTHRFEEIVKAVRKKIKLSERITPHTFRHTFATELWERLITAYS